MFDSQSDYALNKKKDLSRFGRNYTEFGQCLRCRFVSVLDCLDSKGDNTDMLHFHSLMNDYHLRDLSTKIKSVIHNKKINGQYLGSMAPFGYAKSAEDSYRLVIDEYNERTLAQIVAAEIRSHAQAIALDESTVVDKLKQRLAQYDMQEKLTEIAAKLYEDKISGAISEDTFVVLMQKNEQARQSRAERLNVLLSETEQSERETAAVLNWAALVRKHLNLDILGLLLMS